MRDACESALATLRADREKLFPTPDKALDIAVTEWIDKAEQLTFDCDEAVYGDEVADLTSVEEQVNAGLAGL